MNEECRGVQDELPLYEEGSLDPAVAGKIRAHIAGCADCKREAEASAASWKLFREAHSPAELPRSLRAGRFEESPARSRFAVPGWALGLAAAAFLMGVAIGRRAPETSSVPRTAAAPPSPGPARPAVAVNPYHERVAAWPLRLLDDSLDGKSNLTAGPVWREAGPVLTAKPVIRPGPPRLPSAPMLGSGESGLRASPRLGEGPAGLMVTPPTGSRMGRAGSIFG